MKSNRQVVSGQRLRPGFTGFGEVVEIIHSKWATLSTGTDSFHIKRKLRERHLPASEGTKEVGHQQAEKIRDAQKERGRYRKDGKAKERGKGQKKKESKTLASHWIAITGRHDSWNAKCKQSDSWHGIPQTEQQTSFWFCECSFNCLAWDNKGVVEYSQSLSPSKSFSQLRSEMGK